MIAPALPGTPPAAAQFLVALQLGDSAFPSGGFVASWGLEWLVRAARVTDEDDVARFVDGQLRHRWATCDRVALALAHRADGDLAAAAEVDAAVHAVTIAPAARHASQRLGAGLLGVHAALGWAIAMEEQALVRGGRAHGHLPVVQGLLARARGLDEITAVLVAGHQFLAGLVSAAVRLGVVGHLGAQRVLDRARPVLADVAGSELPTTVLPTTLSSSALEAELAMIDHELLPSRLFAC